MSENRLAAILPFFLPTHQSQEAKFRTSLDNLCMCSQTAKLQSWNLSTLRQSPCNYYFSFASTWRPQRFQVPQSLILKPPRKRKLFQFHFFFCTVASFLPRLLGLHHFFCSSKDPTRFPILALVSNSERGTLEREKVSTLDASFCLCARASVVTSSHHISSYPIFCTFIRITRYKQVSTASVRISQRREK